MRKQALIQLQSLQSATVRTFVLPLVSSSDEADSNIACRHSAGVGPASECRAVAARATLIAGQSPLVQRRQRAQRRKGENWFGRKCFSLHGAAFSAHEQRTIERAFSLGKFHLCRAAARSRHKEGGGGDPWLD
ncbi:hypothetical protein MTO96_011801 [Rhipicephalus appendiculatus]